MGEPADAPIKLRAETSARRSFWREYGKDILWARDAKLGYLALVASTATLAASTVARSRLDAVASSGVSLAALGLTFSLASLSLLSGLLDRDVVGVLDGIEKRAGDRRFGLHGLITAFRSVSAVAAAGVLAWLAVRWVSDDRLRGNGWDAAQTTLGGIAAGLTVWLVIGLFQLIGMVADLVGGKAALFRLRNKREP